MIEGEHSTNFGASNDSDNDVVSSNLVRESAR